LTFLVRLGTLWQEGCESAVISHKIMRYKLILVALPLALLLPILAACGGKVEKQAITTPSPTPASSLAATVEQEGERTLALSSTAFEEEGLIPSKYTGDGQDISPPLAWNEPPLETKAFALIVDDLDAPSGVFTHWVLFNLPPDARQLPEGIPAQNQLENHALQGKNDFGRIGYSGPLPPRNSAHRYRFTLYALDQPLGLEAGASGKQVLDAMKEHILAQGQLTAIYQR